MYTLIAEDKMIFVVVYPKKTKFFEIEAFDLKNERPSRDGD